MAETNANIIICHSMHFFLLFHWPRAHYVTYEYLPGLLTRITVKMCFAANNILLMRNCACFPELSNLVPRAHVPFGQHQDTELWNNQFPETKILGLPVSRHMRGLVYMASRDKVEVDMFHKGI